MSRPLTYDAGLHERVTEALRKGATMRDAVAVAGGEWRTFCRWLKAGRIALENAARAPGVKLRAGGDPRFSDLARDVDRALRESDVALVGMIRAAAQGLPRVEAADGRPEQRAIPGDWRAAAFLLEFRAGAPLRRAQLTKTKAEAEVATKRADGSLVDKHDVTSGGKPIGDLTMEEIDARIAAAEQRRRDRGD
ncbi:MAG: hypothetical protein Q8S73_43025 [Deltaproteobacteria bacterium]|nr:hypothetical protein [Myxococcales bacterium]MDP3220936.1 hypothetical protein [Deltaproteobacteria bacterium]